MKNATKKQDLNKWYERNNAAGVYFTPFKRGKRLAMVAEDLYGFAIKDRKPTPEEIVHTLNKYPDIEFYDGSYFTKYNHEQTDEQGVELPSGAFTYLPAYNETPERLVPFELRKDSYLTFPSVYDKLAGDVRAFVSKEHVYREIGDTGIQYRRGLLLYGPPGNGKTSLIRELIRNEVPKDAIVFFCDILPSSSFIDAVKKTLSHRMKVFVFEELVAMLSHTRIERILDFLDGERSLDRTLVIGTTNYPERLPGNLVDRPSRFDGVYKMPDPDSALRKAFLEFFLRGIPILPDEIEATKGFSVAALKEIALLTRLRDCSIEQATVTIRRHKDLVKQEFAELKQIGFASNKYSPDDECYPD